MKKTEWRKTEFSLKFSTPAAFIFGSMSLYSFLGGDGEGEVSFPKPDQDFA